MHQTLRSPTGSCSAPWPTTTQVPTTSTESGMREYGARSRPHVPGDTTSAIPSRDNSLPLLLDSNAASNPTTRQKTKSPLPTPVHACAEKRTCRSSSQARHNSQEATLRCPLGASHWGISKVHAVDVRWLRAGNRSNENPDMPPPSRPAYDDLASRSPTSINHGRLTVLLSQEFK